MHFGPVAVKFDDGPLFFWPQHLNLSFSEHKGGINKPIITWIAVLNIYLQILTLSKRALPNNGPTQHIAKWLDAFAGCCFERKNSWLSHMKRAALLPGRGSEQARSPCVVWLFEGNDLSW
jgi:hypothetical protein